MATKPKDEKPAAGRPEARPPVFDNKPSDLDEATHTELRLLYDRACEALLFAKNIQWRSVGSSLTVFAVFIAIMVFAHPNKELTNIIGTLTIVLTVGVIVVLIFYQQWQFNEISRIVEIEKHFSTLYRHIRDIKPRREGNLHRYTLLAFMVMLVVTGAATTLYVVKQLLDGPA